MFNLTFLNHSSFFLEDTDSILLLDPWFEGKAFNDGWSLIDQTYNNNFVIDLLKSKKKRFIFGIAMSIVIIFLQILLDPPKIDYLSLK